MIVLKATQDKVLAVLQSVAGIVERRHTLPILATVLHAVRKMAAERQQLTELNQQLHVLEQTLKG